MGSNGRRKFARKPLTDISNSRKPSKPDEKSRKDQNPTLGRLLAVHSEFSNLIHQIDELVAQASTCELDSQKLESFTHVLSDVLSTLKLQLPLLKQAVSDSSSRSIHRSGLGGVSSTTQEEKHMTVSPEKHESDSLIISPSPLVSWRAGCRIDSGRQLFLLTPLPKAKKQSSNRWGFTRQKSEGILRAGFPSDNHSLPSPLIAGRSHVYTVNRVDTHTASKKPSVSSTTKFSDAGFPSRTLSLPSSLHAVSFHANVLNKTVREPTPGTHLRTAKPVPDVTLPSHTPLPSALATASLHFNALDKLEVESRISDSSKPANVKTVTSPLLKSDSPSKTVGPKMEQTMYLVTPFRKMSPLKTCKLLEPVPQCSMNDSNVIPSAVRFEESDLSPTIEYTSDVSSIYPELFGLVPGILRRNKLEASLNWFLSPPKTCVVMEPPNEKFGSMSNNCRCSNPDTGLQKDTTDLVSLQDEDTSMSRSPGISSSCFAPPECTPMQRDAESTIRIGKRPGENTLKRELWTKFEAASTSNFQYDVSIFQETKGKGFLDRLEEACEEIGS